MQAVIHAAHGEVAVATDDDGLRLELAGRVVAMRWDAITGAGLAVQPGAGVSLPRDSIELPGGKKTPFDIVPLGSRLERAAHELVASHRALIIGDGGRGFQVSLPADDPGTQALVTELRSRLGGRWRGDDRVMGELRRELGIRTSWGGWVAAVVFVVAVAVLGFLAIAAWAGVKAAWEEGDLSLIRPYTVLALVAWVLGVGYLLRRVRHRRHGGG